MWAQRGSPTCDQDKSCKAVRRSSDETEIARLTQEMLDVENEVYSMVETHQQIPGIAEQIAEIQAEITGLIREEKNYKYSKELLSLACAVKNLPLRLSEA